MTDADIRTLKSYLAESLERPLKFAKEMMEKYAQDGRDAKVDGDTFAVELALGMHKFYKGQATALQHAIDDFKETFEEELKEGE